MNWYAYVGNDPVNFIDPTGLKYCTGSRINRPDGANCFIETGAVCTGDCSNGGGFGPSFRGSGGGGGFSAPGGLNPNNIGDKLGLGNDDDSGEI